MSFDLLYLLIGNTPTLASDYLHREFKECKDKSWAGVLESFDTAFSKNSLEFHQYLEVKVDVFRVVYEMDKFCDCLLSLFKFIGLFLP